ncbi:hypothetical protein ABPG77_002045 [Micractinium sp. CCAP 211/92]
MSYWAVALAEAEGGGPVARERIGQLLAASGLEERFPKTATAERVPISVATEVECYMARPEAGLPNDGCPPFRVDPCGLLVSLLAGPGSPFFFHVDHRLPVSRRGPHTRDNLVALQWRANQAKGARVIVPEVQSAMLLAQLSPHEYVLADQLPAVLAEVDARGLERTFHNVEHVLWDLPPWKAAPRTAKETPPVAHRRAAARHAERRSRRPWSDAESLLLARLVMQQELEQAGSGGRPRIDWERVATGLPGRDAVQCQDRWRGLPRRLQQQGEREQQEGEGEQQRRQVERRYQRWEEEEADDVAELLGALGERLAAAAGTGLPPRLRTLHERLEFVCPRVFGRQLADVFPGKTPKQVADKCVGLVETALKLALNKILRLGGQNGITPWRWEQLAPRVLLLAAELPIQAALRRQVTDGEAAAQIQRFILDPPGHGLPSLPRLADYWAEPAGSDAGAGTAAATGAALESIEAAAAGVAGGFMQATAACKKDSTEASGAAAGAAGQRAVAAGAAGRRAAAAGAAGAAPRPGSAAAPAVGVIDLLSGSEDEWVEAAGPAAATDTGAPPTPAARAQEVAAAASATEQVGLAAAELVDLTLSDSQDDRVPAQSWSRGQGQPAAAGHGPAGAQASNPLLQCNTSGGARASSHGRALPACGRRQRPLHQASPALQEQGRPRRAYTSAQRAAVEAGIQEFGHCFAVHKRIEQKYSGAEGPLRGLDHRQIRNIARKALKARQLEAEHEWQQQRQHPAAR